MIEHPLFWGILAVANVLYAAMLAADERDKPATVMVIASFVCFVVALVRL